MSVDVFISYRGADRVLARKLEHRLRSRWGSRIFRDETSLMAGRPWAEQLEDAMRTAKVMLALVGEGWHLREGEDWVRAELLGAIEAGHPVLPVLIGDPDQLSGRLTELPEAFGRQAVVVNPDLAGFDLHQIEKALRDLGAFGDEAGAEFGQQLAEIVPRTGEERCVEALDQGRSVVVCGASGSGRSSLLRQLVAALRHPAVEARPGESAGVVGAGQRLVAACGLDLGERNRRTHRVVAAWIDGLCAEIAGMPRDERAVLGRLLVHAVLEHGPDLLARQVLRPAALLSLGDDDSDQQVLEAARRPTGGWTPFPPERLVSQSVSVLETIADATRRTLTLVADHVELLDGSSRAVIRRLVEHRHDQIRLVLATSTLQRRGDDSAMANVAAAVELEPEQLADAEGISLHDPSIWGAEGAVIASWLEHHRVEVDPALVGRFTDPNPYYALSSLWYLVDAGHLIEAPVEQPSGEGNRVSNGRVAPVVRWVPSGIDGELPTPSRDQLLDHRIDEYIPVRFRQILAVGALIGRRFPFSAAYAVVNPPESVDDAAPTDAAIDRWRQAADEVWTGLRSTDPDRSVIACHTSVDGERMVELAQIDLVTHLAGRLDRHERRRAHRQLARYFSEPIGTDLGTSLDDRYARASAAAFHWSETGEARQAADAERVAAGLAEQGLAYRAAIDHYRRAIRLFTQLLASSSRNQTVRIEDHQDLLMLANCLYRLGQMARLATDREPGADGASDPTRYFHHALRRLQELSANLHDKRLAAPTQSETIVVSPREIPQPNIIRHHIRLCSVLSGWINLELAEWHELIEELDRSRELLFEALRHAEAARGEADSRWLLTAASVRLAQQLVNDAIRVRVEHPVRAHNLTVEALYQLERVLNLQAVSPEEDRNLEDPRSRAWIVLGQIFQTLLVEPQLAEWAFRRMNEHRRDVTGLVDMMTDRQLGLFLLSTSSGASDAAHVEARDLLGGHSRWAVESGLDREHAAACLSLAVLGLVEHLDGGPSKIAAIRDHLDAAIDRSREPAQRLNAQLLHAILHAIDKGQPGAPSFDDASVVDAFREALDQPDGDDHDLLVAGWTTSLERLLRVCPHLTCAFDLARLRETNAPLASAIESDPHVARMRSDADRYLSRLGSTGAKVPTNDRTIWTLLRGRVAFECYEHAVRAARIARKLVEVHHDDWQIDAPLPVLQADIEYAVAVVEWYRSTDPSRLLALARESNMSISGAEWASPKLLGGRLALQVLDRQYDASAELGRERFSRISSMVTNWAIGDDDAGPLEQVVTVALQLSEPLDRSIEWRGVATESGRLADAYRAALDERAELVHQAGLPILQDLHLFDADNADVTTVRPDDPDLGMIDPQDVPGAEPTPTTAPIDIDDRSTEVVESIEGELHDVSTP